MKPIVNGLEPKYSGKITFLEVDVDTDQGQTIAEFLGSQGSIPAFYFVKKDGRNGDNMVGVTTAEDLENHLNALLQ